MSHTYVTLAVSQTVFAEIKEKLAEAGYFFDDELDMHGIALVVEEADASQQVR